MADADIELCRVRDEKGLQCGTSVHAPGMQAARFVLSAMVDASSPCKNAAPTLIHRMAVAGPLNWARAGLA